MNQQARNHEAGWITAMIVLTLIAIFIPSGFVISIMRGIGHSLETLGIPFAYVFYNFHGISGIIRTIFIVCIDGIGLTRCFMLTHSNKSKN